MTVTDSLRRVDRAPSVKGSALPPVAMTVAVSAILCLVTGVRVSELIGFAAYQAVFVVAPGVLVVRAVIPGPVSRTTLLAIGWPMGFALEIGAFCAAAALGARWLFAVYPLVVLVACSAVAWRRRSEVPADVAAMPRLALWASATATVAAVVLLAMLGFATNALPRDVPSVVPYVDNVFDVAVAAEARHHWPIENPNVSGEPLRYHVLAFVDAAAVNQVTGIDLDVVLFRLQAMLLVLLVAFQVSWLALRAAPRCARAAPLAVAITLFANELDLGVTRDHPLSGLFFNSLPFSPTFAMGLPFFIAATAVLLDLLTARERSPRGWWFVLAIVSACAMGAKGSTLPVLLVGLAAFVAARLVLDRAVDRVALRGLAVVAAAFVVMYLALFRGGASGTTLDPLSWMTNTDLAEARTHPLLAPAGALFATAGLLAPWLGAVLLIGRLRDKERIAALWLGAVAVGAVVPFMALGAAGGSQVYFLQYGTPAAAVLSAWGIVRSRPSLPDRIPALGGLVALALLAATAIAAAEAAGVLASYVLLVIVVGSAALAVARGHVARALPVAVTALVALTLLDVPLDVAPTWAQDEADGRPHHVRDTRDGEHGIATELLAGLRWLRGHSRTDDVIAVQVQSLAANALDPRYFVYAAYAERRTFLGGWAYATPAVGTTPQAAARLFASRQRLNAAAFRGDPSALATLRTRYGVRFLLVDLRHGRARPTLDRSLRRVHATREMRIYANGP